MRFHAMMPVRDEADLLAQSLEQILQWVDTITILDTGSADETWEIVQDFAKRDSRVRPLSKKPVYYQESPIRGLLFEHARRDMENGDWFLRVDTDEFHHLSPRDFVKERLAPHETIVWHQYYDFRLTEPEAAAWERGEETVADRSRPITDRRRWYTISTYSEPRMCRYRSTMKWPPTVSFPYNAGFVARERLPIRHYPYRDPEQLDRRCKIRLFTMAYSEMFFTGYTSAADKERAIRIFAEMNAADPATCARGKSELLNEWRRFVAPLDFPGLQKWEPGTPLPEPRQLNHLAAPAKRMVQRIVHQTLLPVLDRRRPGWKENDGPQRIPEDLAKRLEAFINDPAFKA
jgi:hypothetical protein